MSPINSRETEMPGRNITQRKSLQGINGYSHPSALPRLGFKTPSYDAEGKDCMVSKIPRPAMTASYSFNETLKSNQSNGKTKRAPSMIPRSKSRKRNEMGKMRIDIPSKAESPKRYFKKPGVFNKNKESSEDPLEDEFELFVSPMENENKMSKQELEISRLSFKSCQDDFKDMSYAEGQEDVFSASPIARKEEEIKGPPEEETFDKGGEVVEEDRETRTIRHLYETIKCTAGPLFEELNWTHPEKFKRRESDISSCDSTMAEAMDGTESLSDSSSVQEHYNFTLREISNVWKSSLSLLGSVRNHAVQFVEEKDQLIDKEQLALEAEMLQAALDFAISYSKLKTEFLITLVKERLNISDVGANKLENLMDSKVFATFYNVEDLASMAQNVHDLSASLLRGEDLEMD